MDFSRYLTERRVRIERALARYVPAEREQLRQAIRYSLLAGGKRIRPILVLAAGEVVGAPGRALMPFACALEMIHTYSLVHDDLPAMDNDDRRRGRLASHRKFGEGLAILVGDALLTDAFAVMAGARGLPVGRVVQAIGEVAAAAGSVGMVGGQALDIAAAARATRLPYVQAIHARKTGALLRVAVRVGALLGGSAGRTLGALTRYGEHLGLAFQIADDILDAAEVPLHDGRTDRTLEKATYPAMVGLDGSRRELVRVRDAASRALSPLGDRAVTLREIVSYVAQRALSADAAT